MEQGDFSRHWQLTELSSDTKFLQNEVKDHRNWAVFWLAMLGVSAVAAPPAAYAIVPALGYEAFQYFKSKHNKDQKVRDFYQEIQR